jgi:hypothetical protein
MTTDDNQPEGWAPQSPRAQLVSRVFTLFLEICDELGKLDDTCPTEVVDDIELGIHAALGVDQPLAKARDFLQADIWHRESARLDLVALQLLFRNHQRLQAAVDAANARQVRRIRAA